MMANAHGKENRAGEGGQDSYGGKGEGVVR